MKIAVADGNWMLHRIFHTQVESKDPARMISSRLLSLVCKDALAVKSKKLLVAFDGPNVFRHKLADSYKSNRDKNKEDLDLIHNKDGLNADDGPYKYLPEIMVYFADAGIPVVQFSEYEADDVLASVAYQNDSVALMSRDKDMYQTLREGVTQYDSAFKVKGQPAPRTITHKDVESIFGVPANLCVDLQTLTGDGVDNVPRLVRKDVAIRGLLKHGSLQEWLKQDKEFAEKMKANKVQLNLNRKLVKLVTDIKVDLPDIKWCDATNKLPSVYFQYKDFCNPKSKGLF